MSKFCTSCGQRLNDIDKFCPTCGTKQVFDESLSNVATGNTHTTLTDTFSIDRILEKEIGKVGGISGAIGGFTNDGLFGEIGGGFGGKIGASWAASKLKTDEVHDKVVIPKNITASMTTVLQALSSMGKIIDASQYTDNPVVSALCRSGFANMNPCVVRVELIQISTAQTDLHISGYAKEGLIKQNTAKKAISKLKAMISS